MNANTEATNKARKATAWKRINNCPDYDTEDLIKVIDALTEQLKHARNSLVSIETRATKARQYGPDMLSSKELCIDDVISLAQEAITYSLL